MVHGAQIHNQNLANIVYRGPSHMLHFLTQAATQGKATQRSAEPPALCACICTFIHPLLGSQFHH